MRVGATDIAEIKYHGYFAGFDWNTLHQTPPPPLFPPGQLQAHGAPAAGVNVSPIARFAQPKEPCKRYLLPETIFQSPADHLPWPQHAAAAPQPQQQQQPSPVRRRDHTLSDEPLNPQDPARLAAVFQAGHGLGIPVLNPDVFTQPGPTRARHSHPSGMSQQAAAMPLRGDPGHQSPRGSPGTRTDPQENCHLNEKKLPKI